ncbi:MAG: lipid-A-disaccharide synthase N-terminal domain-containing protein [Methylococcales bacterium]|nr:lipid-A-disaccharide synthase N-terminal domain-containing protein [Methylococcales bacterium]
MDNNTIWLVVGFLGQGLFSARFIVQWVVSERKKQSVIPVLFWYFSILGGIVLLLYSIHKQDPVFILGQGAGLLIYFRNLYFVLRHPHPKASEQ